MGLSTIAPVAVMRLLLMVLIPLILVEKKIGDRLKSLPIYNSVYFKLGEAMVNNVARTKVLIVDEYTPPPLNFSYWTCNLGFVKDNPISCFFNKSV